LAHRARNIPHPRTLPGWSSTSHLRSTSAPPPSAALRFRSVPLCSRGGHHTALPLSLLPFSHARPEGPASPVRTLPTYRQPARLALGSCLEAACARLALGLRSVCARGRRSTCARGRRSTCARFALGRRSTCARLATCARLCSTCARLALGLRSTCARLALDLRSTCARLALDLRSTCARPALGRRSTCARPALDMRSTCARLALDMRSTCAQLTLDRLALDLRSTCARRSRPSPGARVAPGLRSGCPRVGSCLEAA